jgi:predicted TIM-barrel fold metal-dependent hydrolase
VRDHVRVSLQPVDGPPEPKDLLRVIDQLGSERMLMFSSDYPHRHVAEELDAVPEGIPPALADALLSGNAREHYRL